MQGRRVTVSLSGRDLIVDTEAVGRYLARNQDNSHVTEDWKTQTWKGRGLDVLWFNELDHAQIFDSRQDRQILVKAIVEYSLSAEQDLIKL